MYNTPVSNKFVEDAKIGTDDSDANHIQVPPPPMSNGSNYRGTSSRPI